MKGSLLRDRGYLPHLEARGATYFITLRLADTLPATLLQQMPALQTVRYGQEASVFWLVCDGQAACQPVIKR